MRRTLLLAIMALALAFPLRAQEFRCSVSVNAQQVQTNEKKVFETMKQAIEEFVNNRKWTNVEFEPYEKLECNISLIISEQTSLTDFGGQLSVQLRRPVYNSNYTTGIMNFVEPDFQFSFNESQPLEFDPNTFYSNLSMTLGYYLYVMLGITFDSYGLQGGEPFFEVAQTIVQTSNKSGYRGWKTTDGQKARYWWMENHTNPNYATLRQAYYYYHRMGLDMMTKDQTEARKNIIQALQLVQQTNKKRTNLLCVQMFMDVKIPEIVNIFTPAPQEEKKQVYDLVRQISPINLNKMKDFNQ
ncbi:MAG: DUF4835 family protein [Bacteroidales bacterium]|nr:DUF4835 family protein [Bacteroidales bacterium]